jgi:hypothetical protein
MSSGTRCRRQPKTVLPERADTAARCPLSTHCGLNDRAEPVYALDVRTVRFKNGSAKQIEVLVEPWANSFLVSGGSDFAIHYEPPQGKEDRSQLEILDAERIAFWCEGDTFKFEIGGEIVMDH